MVIAEANEAKEDLFKSNRSKKSGVTQIQKDDANYGLG